jgi:carboxylate-amine ligase
LPFEFGQSLQWNALLLFGALFLALSAASPFFQGADTAFDSSRSNVVGAFPLTGTAPAVVRWSDFEAYYNDLQQPGIVASMKDFYWDIRPKPEYGAVEVRVCDTPLTVEGAALLGCYAQLLSRWLLTERPFEIGDDVYLLYQYNRFEASRFGLKGQIAERGKPRQPIHASIVERMQGLGRFTSDDAEIQALGKIAYMAGQRLNDATWLRQIYKERGSLNDVVRLTADAWMNRDTPPYFR